MCVCHSTAAEDGENTREKEKRVHFKNMDMYTTHQMMLHLVYVNVTFMFKSGQSFISNVVNFN